MMLMEGWDSVENWLGRLSESSHKVHRFHFGKFMEWLGANGGECGNYTPDRLVQVQRSLGNGNQYVILDLVQRWVIGMRGRASYKRRAYSVVRSFFLHNRSELPKDTRFNVRGDAPKVVGSLSVEELRNMILSSNPCYQAVFLCMLQGGMGVGEITYWSDNGYDKLLEDLDMKLSTVRVDLPGRKKFKFEKPYYTFLGEDAQDSLRKWIKTRPPEAEAIFVGDTGKPLNYWAIHAYWMRHLFKLGIIEKKPENYKGNRYGKNLHEIRDLFRTLWQKSGAEGTAAEFFMGHIVDPLEYNKAFRDEDYAREQYEEAQHFLEIMSRPEAYKLTDARKVRQLEDEVERLRSGQDERIKELEESLREMEEFKQEILRTLKLNR